MHDWRCPAPAPFIAAVIVGFLASLSGTYWDAGWHTVHGRDTLLSPPHVALYAGISLLGAAFALRALAVVRAQSMREALAAPSLRLGIVGASVTLAAGPIDDAWHRVFGRDAVIWSPPHMLGVIGTLAIAAAFLVEIRSAGPSQRRFEPLAGAALLAACLIPVLEYDLDVPQFSLAFYLPVLATGASFAFALIGLGAGLSYPAARAAAIYTVVLGAVGVALGAFGYPAPALPLLLPAALVADRYGRRSAIAAGTLTTAVIFAACLSVRALAGQGLGLSVGAIAASGGLAALGSSLAFALAHGRIRSSSRAVAVATALVSLAVATAPAFAHDPGQGPEAGRAALTANASGQRARLTVDWGQIRDCAAVRPRQLRARRAGTLVTAQLASTGRCAGSGSVKLPASGRWFIYAELERQGNRLETWLPLEAGASARAHDSDRVVYEPRARETTALKVGAGVIVYVLMLIVMTAIARSVRTGAAV